jgi:hypothetical protein
MKFNKIRLMRVTFAVVYDVKLQSRRLNMFPKKERRENKTVETTFAYVDIPGPL